MIIHSGHLDYKGRCTNCFERDTACYVPVSELRFWVGTPDGERHQIDMNDLYKALREYRLESEL